MSKKIALFFVFVTLLIGFDCFLGPFQYLRAHDTFSYYLVDIQHRGQNLLHGIVSMWNHEAMCGQISSSNSFSLSHPAVWLAG
jgi:hypothetical protein